jgi:hypothetical protein
MPIGDYRFTFLVPVLLANGPEFVKEQKRDSLFPQELKKSDSFDTRPGIWRSAGILYITQQVHCS